VTVVLIECFCVRGKERSNLISCPFPGTANVMEEFVGTGLMKFIQGTEVYCLKDK
jgi:hypothetical protein